MLKGERPIKEFCELGALSPLTTDASLKVFYQKAFSSRSPFVPVVDQNAKFVGNLWLTRLPWTSSEFPPETAIQSLIDQFPSAFEREHYCRSDSPMRSISSGNFLHFCVPVVDSEDKLLGALDLLSMSFSSVLPQMSVSLRKQRRKILVVDDELEFLEILHETLELKGYVCLTAASGQAALDTVKSHPDIDAVLCDLTMPGLSGLPLIQAFRAHDPYLPIIVLSGHSDAQLAVDCLKNGAADYISKPMPLERVVESIRVQESQLQERALDLRRHLSQQILTFFGGMIAHSTVSFVEKAQALSFKIGHFLQAEGVSVILYLCEAKNFHVVGSTKEKLQGKHLSFDEAPVLKNLLASQLSLVSATKLDLSSYKVESGSPAAYRTNTAMVIPMIAAEKTVGFVCVSDKWGDETFCEADLEVLQSIVGPLALMLDYATLAKRYEEVVGGRRVGEEAPVATPI